MKKRIICAAMATMLSLNIGITSMAASYSYVPNNYDFMSWFSEYFGNHTTEENSVTELDRPVISVTGSFNKTKQIRKINIDWETVDCAENYVVQLSLNEDFNDIYKEKETTNDYMNFTFSSGGNAPYYFPANATYYIRVKAVSDNAESDWSNTVVSSVSN